MQDDAVFPPKYGYRGETPDAPSQAEWEGRVDEWGKPLDDAGKTPVWSWRCFFGFHDWGEWWYGNLWVGFPCDKIRECRRCHETEGGVD